MNQLQVNPGKRANFLWSSVCRSEGLQTDICQPDWTSPPAFQFCTGHLGIPRDSSSSSPPKSDSAEPHGTWMSAEDTTRFHMPSQIKQEKKRAIDIVAQNSCSPSAAVRTSWFGKMRV